MAQYRVTLENYVSTVIEVEADSKDEAIDAAFDTDRSLQLMFLDQEFYLETVCRYPDEGEWEVYSVEEVKE